MMADSSRARGGAVRARPRRADLLDLGPDLVQRLLPHRRPMLMVDRIVGFRDGPQPTLWAQRYISVNEPVFAGHFPQLSLWPGVLTIEALGQCTNLLVVLRSLARSHLAGGHSVDDGLAALRNAEAAARLSPRADASAAEALFASLPRGAALMGFAAAVDVKLLTPVFAGALLELRATVTHEMGPMMRSDVEASVEGKPVARGSLTCKLHAHFGANSGEQS